MVELPSKGEGPSFTACMLSLYFAATVAMAVAMALIEIFEAHCGNTIC